MKKIYLIGLLILVLVFAFSNTLSAKIVDTALGREFTKIFPKLSNDYIDLNGNGEIDRLEDMDEKVPDSSVKDGIVQVQEILDFVSVNFRFIAMEKLLSIKSSLTNVSGNIPELISLNYSSLIDEIVAEKERLGANDLYLTPSAMKAAKVKMSGFIATMLNAYRKEERQYEDAFAKANLELFRMIEAGYPLPELNADDKELLTNLTIHTIIKEKASNITKVLAAIRTLGRLKAKEAIPYLQELLSSPDYSIETAISLGNIGSTEARKILMDSLNSEEPGKLKNTLIMALGKTGGDESVKLILSLLDTGSEEETGTDYETEKTIVSSLASLSSSGIKDRKVYSFLTEYLSHTDPEIRILAISGIAAYKTAAATALLTPILKTEKSEDVLVELVNSLSLNINPSIILSFSSLLQDSKTSDELKTVLLDAIGINKNGFRAVALVVGYLGSENKAVRNSAANTLEKLYVQNGPVVIGGINRGVNLSTDEQFLTVSSDLLSRIADTGSIVTVLNLLGSTYPEVKKNATWTLYRMSPANNVKVVTELQKLVPSETESIEVRINAVRALGSMGYDSARQEVWKTLLTTLKLKDSKYRMLKLYGIKALGEMGTVNKDITDNLATVALRESDETLKLAAVNSLRTLSSTDPSVEKALVNSFKRNDDDMFRISILEALGDMGSDETSNLASLLLVEDKMATIKERTVYVLSHIGDEKSLSLLLDVSTDEDISDYLMGTLEDANRTILNSLVQRRLKTETDSDRMSILENLNSQFESY
ncbi:MAG: HEAT repeat domain-containing protein [Spirochaetia bacterium]|jgi:HEAT repeat protein|nr:HEAT repeat domain-containing protein [Spirochaetia bacterium]